MKKSPFLFLFITSFLLLNSVIFAQSRATSMGDLLTVSPTGPFDVIRNPALLPIQSVNNSLGLFYTYVHHVPDENKIDLYLNMDGNTFDSVVEVEDPKIIGMTCNIAYLSKIGNSALGFAITSSDNDQYRINESETYFSSTYGLYEIKSHEKIKTTQFDPVFITSAGFTISKNSYFGFQLLIKYTKINEDREIEQIVINGGTVQEENRKKSEKEVNGIRAEMGFGYLYKSKDIQLGLLLRSGNFSWIKKKIKINSYSPGIGSFQSSSDVTINGERTSGPGISAGGYKRINSFFAAAIESVFIFEHSYSDKDFNYIDDENRIDTEENIQKSRNAVMFKGGIELNPSKSLAVTMGLGNSFLQFESHQMREHEDRSIGKYEANYTYCTSGLQYLLGRNISIEMMAAFFYFKNTAQAVKLEEDETEHNEILHKVKSSGYFIFTGLGIVLSF